MSKWDPIVSGRRAWAALRDLSRRWCLGVGAGPARRVAAKGFSPEAYRARQIMPKLPADVSRMGARTTGARTVGSSYQTTSRRRRN